MARPKPLDSPAVLIVESEGLVRLELARGFRQMGLLALEARDADEAIALLADHPKIRLIVTDIRMPGSMDGIRLAHHVRNRWPPVKIIVASGRLETELSELPSGSVFLAKPFEHGTLWQAATQLLKGGGARSAGHCAA
jgi:CheY-like chemotaxis protein